MFTLLFDQLNSMVSIKKKKKYKKTDIGFVALFISQQTVADCKQGGTDE